jgi:hypothetical protein
MDRSNLEDAINELNRLLHNGEAVEEKYQAYFEKNTVIFEMLGYAEVYPRPKLPLPDGEFLVPDFLAKRVNNLFEIIDLKTPQEKLLKPKKHRNNTYAKIGEYISQVEYYSEYFDDSENRQAIQKTLGLDVQQKPDTILIVGLDSNTDKKLLHLLIRRRTNALKIITYDELLSLLQFHHFNLFGNTENLPGASWYAMVTPRHLDVKRRKYIFDCGDTLFQNRWSIYLDERDWLTFELTDIFGKPYSTSVQPGTCGFNLEEQCIVACEFGSSDTYGLLQILINNRLAAKLEVASQIKISSGFNFKYQTIGADITGHNNGKFDMAALAVYNKVLNFREKSGLTERMFEEFNAKS